MRITVPESLKTEILGKTNNRCCICQTPLVVIHHLDENPSNNAFDNLAPLCPNCHSQAHSSSKMTINLTQSRIRSLRDTWYAYCEKRKDYANVSPNAILKIKTFRNSAGYPQPGWQQTFSAIDPAYATMTVNDIIERVFSTSNRDDIVAYLTAVKHMYTAALREERTLQRFLDVCSAFGVDYDQLL